jgi:hypothetical protein
MPSNSLCSVPTAMHAVADVHETPFMRPPVASCIVQVLPSQYAANPPTKNEPMAIHAVADVHATPSRKAEGKSRPTPGVEVVWIVHVLPFQNSASVAPMPLLPTAVQAVADVHETPFRLPPLGLGVVWVVQVLPSQRSTNVPPLPEPTAVHAEADVHETAFRPPPLGVVWIVQVLPSQRCTPPDPRAVHAVADVHETAFRLPPPPEVGVIWIVQVLPSQSSASVPKLPKGLAVQSPTAVHAVADAHDTPDKLLTIAPLGLGMI